MLISFCVPVTYAETFAALAEKCTQRCVLLEICTSTIRTNFPWLNLEEASIPPAWLENIGNQVGHYDPIDFSP
jgi:hypothetical protein